MARNTGEWLEQQLRRYTYKPGWRLYGAVLTISSFPFYRIRVIMRVEDTYNKGRMIEVFAERILLDATWLDEDQFAKTLSAFLVEMEVHESKEWLRRDGEIYDDPHKPRERT